MLIKVTQQDIENGRRGSSCFCPIALATARTLGLPPRKIKVTRNQFWEWLIEIDRLVRYLPDQGSSFASRFDAGWPVEPFTMDLSDRGACMVRFS